MKNLVIIKTERLLTVEQKEEIGSQIRNGVDCGVLLLDESFPLETAIVALELDEDAIHKCKGYEIVEIRGE